MLAAVLLTVLSTGACSQRYEGPFLGTLGTRAQTAAQESAGGIKVAMVELRWSSYETKPGVFDTEYERRVADQLAALRAAGMRITLGLGLHYAPRWVSADPANHYVDQDGNRSDQIDLTFNAAVRQEAEDYLARAASALDFASLWAVRVTSGGRSELLYPGGGSYWAYGEKAVTGRGLPAGMTPNPAPQWRPGSDSLSPEELRSWYGWYVASLVSGARWQMSVAREHGFTGWFEILTPGRGLVPTQLDAQLAEHLPEGLAGLGVAWQDVYAQFAGTDHVVASVTSMADGSGGNGGCQAGDDDVPLTDPEVQGWSAVRWISRIAGEHGFGVTGENPGYTASPEYQRQYRDTSEDGLMAVAAEQARSCGMRGWYWAHDDQLWDGTVDLDRLLTYTSTDAVPPPSARQR